MIKNYKIGFYLEKIYFLPHFEPIIRELTKRNISYMIIIPHNLKRDILDQSAKSIHLCQEKGLKVDYDNDFHFDILVFANITRKTKSIADKTAIVYHGLWGGKSVHLQSNINNTDIRFVDGQMMFDSLTKYYPDQANKYKIVGYSKLDMLNNYCDHDKKVFIATRGLDPKKKTILYAPTFYPSSIEGMSDTFPSDFTNYNIIVKPHANIFLREKYKRERQKIQQWAKYSNVYLTTFEETDIIPFIYACDCLLSDISSVIYEFASANKPVIVNRFIKYRWYHYLFGDRIKNGMDYENFYLWNVGTQVYNYLEMVQCTKIEIEHPELHEKKRNYFTDYVTHKADGKASVRIVDELLKMSN